VLAERGLDVIVQAREEPKRTASWAAGAIWGPLDSHHEDVTRWSEVTRQMLLDLEGPEAGVRLTHGLEASREYTDLPAFLKCIDVQHVDPIDLVHDFRLRGDFRTAWRYAAPVINMPVYLPYLQSRLEKARGRMVLGPVRGLATDLPGRVVINCSGSGAYDLVPDATVEAVRGQLVVVENPGIEEFFAEYGGDPENLTYIFPMNDRQVVLGSTYERGNRSPEPSPEIARGILSRCISIDKRLVGVRVLDDRVGFRCIREGGVRLEYERVGNRDVIHNYGHGSGGVSLSWGCAIDVASRVTALLG
jgi:D-amino-acid oxidase